MEVILFTSLLSFFENKIFIINLSSRTIMVIFFGYVAKKFIFEKSKNFYSKFFILSVINPLVASIFLVLFIQVFIDLDVVLIKIFSDVFNSILFYVILNKIA